MRAAHDTIWQTIDQTLLGLAARAGDLDAEIGRWLVAASREGVHRHFGFASFAEYVERRLGFDARTTRERLRVARALEELPEVRRLLAAGERPWSAVREITRVATPENESAWVARTERMTVRQIERMVAGRKPGDDPTDAKDPLLTTRRVVFELEAEAYSEWREANEAVRRVVGPGASDKEVLRAMCEIALGRRDETKPGYQISLTVCTRCDRSWRQSGPDAIEVPPAVGERAACDAEVVGFTCIDEGVAEVISAPMAIAEPMAEPTALRPIAELIASPMDGRSGSTHVDLTSEAMAGRSGSTHVDLTSEAMAGRSGSTHVDLTSEAMAGRSGSTHVDLTSEAMAEPTHVSATHAGPIPDATAKPTGASPGGPIPEATAERTESTHSGPIPEAIAELLRAQGARGLVRAVSAYCGLELRAMTTATRKRVALRDGHRCSVPGCPNFRFVDVHHLRARALGGSHDDDQLTSLCTQHHDAVHDSRLVIEGKPSTGLRFFDARGELYGSRPTWVG